MDMTEGSTWNASLSTMWAMKNFSTLESFFATSLSLGFSHIELNHQVDSAIMEGVDLKHYPISSIHEPCPADISVHVLNAQDWLISATDAEKRKQGVLAVKRSIDLAGSLGVKTLIVHPGNVRFNWPREKELYYLYSNGQANTPQFLEVKNQLIEDRAAMAGPRLEAVQQSLVELLQYAIPRGVRMGLENRYHYMDIPILEEMKFLLELAVPEQLGFWYDIGHAQTLDRLGFSPHLEWLKRFAGRIVGIHLHDVVGINDHHAPGVGEVDFAHIAGYLPVDAVHTLELKASTTAEQVKSSLLFLTQKGCIRSIS
jgi:sugar phosphate isomerase/epimerase